MKRFYKHASADRGPEGWMVLLDGKPVRTPARALLTLPVPALAQAIAAEWDGQDQEVRPQTMPLTQLAATAIDRVAPRPGPVVEALIRYADTDLLCYRASDPPELVRRQRAAWQPLLDWAAERFGVSLQVTESVTPLAHPPAVSEALRRRVATFPPLPLTALQLAVGASGSLVVGLALAEGRLNAEQAWQVALVDDLYQVDRWGDDPAAEAARATTRADLEAAARLLALLAA